MGISLKIHRQSGILLHLTALPGPYGIGEIGPYAYRFVDHLSDMGQSLWQILPVGPTDVHNSPYSSSSIFAGNHLLISLDLLIEDGLLDPEKLKDSSLSKIKQISFEEVINFKIPIIQEVSKQFARKASAEIKVSFEKFCIDNTYWLDDYALYCSLKIENDGKSWIDWQEKEIQNTEYVYETKVIQFLFHDQWHRLRKYCKDKGIKIIGDMPIYVGYDSADVYTNQELFQLDSAGKMAYQSGAPPCQYKEEGQLWGNPLYNWDNHERTNFKWWQRRFKKLFEMVDIIRLDHFIGYSKYYRIPIDNITAHNGEWIQAPGDKLFQVLQNTIKDFNVFVEDLGDVTEDVINLRDKYCFSGMRVLQFELDQMLAAEDYPENAIVCTGTHDNDTINGWFQSLPESSADEAILTKDKMLQYFQCTSENIHWEIINYALSTTSNTVIIPFQDILGENSSGRFNIPGTLSADNWSWRMKEKQLTQSLKTKLTELTISHNRNNSPVNNLLEEELE